MAISRASDSSIQDGLPKFNDIWDGTTATSAFDTLGAVQVNTAVSSIAFSNIPQTYTHLQFRIMALGTTSTGYDFYARFGTGGTIDANGNYAWHDLYGNGATVGARGGANQTIVYVNTDAVRDTYPTVGTFDILDYANNNKYPTVRVLSGTDWNGSGNVTLKSGHWRSTAVLNSITFYVSTGNFATGTTISLYGVK